MATEHADMSPATGFVQGNIAGIEAFRAMLNDARADGDDYALRILCILTEAVEAVREPQTSTSRKSAAVKLLELVADSLEFRLKNDDCEAWLNAELRAAERHRRTVTRHESMRNTQKAKNDARFQSFMACATAR